MSQEAAAQLGGASVAAGGSNGSLESSLLSERRGSADTRSSSSQGATKGILTNAHEAPKKPAKQNDSSIRSVLKAAFVPPQPGKQIKTNGKPLGKSFERKQPLPAKHEGAEVLKIDPRGENASVGDGIVLSPTEDGPGDGSQFGGSSPGQESLPGGSETTAGSREEFQPASVEGTGSAMSSDGGFRGRSDTMSSEASSVTSRSGSIASTSTNHCQIKFAPLPTSGRLKRANSITIGVAARSQLLHSQGAGRSSSGGNNSAAWQAQLRQQQQQQQQQQYNAGDRYSGIQEQRARQPDTIDLGVELRKSAANVWNRVRRGSSVSSSASSGDSNGAAAAAQNTPSVPAVTEEHEYEGPTGEKTPRRPSTPTIHDAPATDQTLPDDNEPEPEGARTPRHPMQRRVSTGTFIGAQSFREMEEKRKRAHREEYDADDAEAVYSTPTDEEANYMEDNNAVDSELSAQFAEKLGRTGESRVLHHTSNKPWHPGMLSMPDGPGKDTDVIDVQNGGAHSSSNGHDSAMSSEGESSYEANDDDEEDDEDDEEAREAERLADEALKEHSAKATQAGGVEKMEKKRSALSRLVGA